MVNIYKIPFDKFSNWADILPKGVDPTDVAFVAFDSGEAEIVFQTDNGKGSVSVHVDRDHVSLSRFREEAGVAGSVLESDISHASLQMWKGVEYMCRGCVLDSKKKIG